MNRNRHTDASRKARETPRQRLKRGVLLAQVALLGVVILECFAIWNSWSELKRDRPSVTWPSTRGEILVDASYWRPGGRHRLGYHYVDLTYTYAVDGRRYAGHRVRLWDPNLSQGSDPAEVFARLHPAHSSVDVFYNPRDPGDAALATGADEKGGKLIIFACCVGLPFVVLLIFHVQRVYLKARRLPRYARSETADGPREKDTGPVPAEDVPDGEGSGESPAGMSFLSYEPACKRKLNAFPDEDCLKQVLGQDGEKVQDWKPNDRIIDSNGRVYRLIPKRNRKSYDMEATGETWDYQKAFDLAVADANLLKRDSKALRQRVEESPEEKKLAVIIDYVDRLPAGPKWFWFALALFLILFFLAVFLGSGWLFMRLQK